MNQDKRKRVTPASACIGFFQNRLWDLDLGLLTPGKRFLVNLVKIVYIVVRGFLKDSCPLRASAMTYASLLSIVPLMAFAFALAKGFNVSMDPLKGWIIEKIALGNYEIGNRIFDFVNNIKATTLGVPALALLLVSIISVMGNIELSFNHIWGITVSRSIWRKFSDYLSVLAVTPLLVIAGGGLAAYLRSYAEGSLLMQYQTFTTAYGFLVRLLPGAMVCLGFTFLYIFMPNTRVRFFPALAGGVAGGVVWQIALWGYLYFQVGFARYAQIYGAMAQIPITLVWVYTSWLIVLFGAEVAFAVQNVRTYQREEDARSRSWAYRELVSLGILDTVARRFLAGEEPLGAARLSGLLDIPVRSVEQALDLMRRGGLLVRTEGRAGAYIPARDLAGLSVAAVLNSLRETGGPETLPPSLAGLPVVSAIRSRIEEALEKSGGRVTILELASRDPRPPREPA